VTRGYDRGVARSGFEASAAEAEQLDAILAEVARSLEADLDALTARVAEQIHAEMPELGEHARITARTLAAVRANLAGFLDFMRAGVPAEEVTITSDTAEYARAFVHRGIALPVAMRTFRLGHAHMQKAWAEAIERAHGSTQLHAALMDVVSTAMFAFVDRTTTALVEEYQAERERWNRSADARRAETVASILDEDAIDIDAASRTLNYDLRRWHLGLVLWSDVAEEGEAPTTDLQHAAGALAEALGGSARPLIIPMGATALWVWVASADRPADDAVERLLAHARNDDIAIAAGCPGRGVEGFRNTHRTAILTRRVMRLSAKRRRAAQSFRAVAFMSLLTADVDQMRVFVADELGDLALDDDATSRLRATLLVYFDERSSAVRTARRLGVHTNTVNYRVRRCAELIGHPVHERRAEIEAALTLKQQLGLEAFHGD